MIKFQDNQNLGKVVDEIKTFSEIGTSNITDRRQLIIAGGRHKFSRLCGFLFNSNVTLENKQFGIVFICKLRSKINHQQKKQVGGQWTIPSRWFALVRTGSNQIDVLDKKTLLGQYQFNVDMFFNSDLFDAETKKFQKTIRAGLKQAHDFAESINDPYEKRDALEEVASIELSIPLIHEDRFEDKKYKLINYMKENVQIEEGSFDQYDWKNGSLTGKGLMQMIQDASTSKQNTLTAPVKVYDRNSNVYYNIVDSHLGKKNVGLMLEIDTTKKITESVDKDIDAAWSALHKKWEKPRRDGDIFEDINAIIPNFQDELIKKFRGIINDYHIENAITYIIDKEEKNDLWDKSTTPKEFLKNVIDVAADWMHDDIEKAEAGLPYWKYDFDVDESDLNEADAREPISHALDTVGIKASTANTVDQDAVEMQLIEKEIDADVEEAMKEIYK